MRFLLSLFLLINFCLYSQEKFSLGILNSFNFSSKDSYLGVAKTQVNPLENSYSLIRGSLASGYSIGGVGAISINSNFKIDLEFTKFLGYNSLLYLNELNGVYQKTSAKLNQNRITPYLSIVSKYKKLDFFMSFGVILPFNSTALTNSYYVDNILNTSKDIIEKNRYNFTWGFANKVGFIKSIGKHISTKFDFGFNLFNLTTKSKEIVTYKVNGVDMLNTLDSYHVSTNYFPNLNNFNNNELYNNQYDLNKSKEELQQSINMNSLFLSLTFFYKF